MIIAKIEANENGTRNIQTINGGAKVPDGYIAIPDEFVAEVREFKSNIDIDIADGVVIGVSQGKAAVELTVDREIDNAIREKEKVVSTPNDTLLRGLECLILGQPLPPDIVDAVQELHMEREVIRADIAEMRRNVAARETGAREADEKDVPATDGQDVPGERETDTGTSERETDAGTSEKETGGDAAIKGVSTTRP